MIQSSAELRERFATPSERALRKQLSELDAHCLRFIELAPFVVLSSSSLAGQQDASPRGGEPGFVQVCDSKRLWIPDAPGNNRLDTLVNIVETARLGLLFLIPGVDETLRVNGRACVRDDAELLERFEAHGRRPKVVIELELEEAYLHCAKALMRSRLWSAESQLERSSLPTLGTMLQDQLGTDGPIETQAQMVERYTRDL